MLPINEHFVTIQGEAKYTGTPSLFIRLQGCPVGCSFCDTKHTWEVDPEFKVADVSSKVDDEPTYAELNTSELLKLVGNSGVKHIVFTGGEPAMYDLTEITGTLIALGYTVQIETSGTYPIYVNYQTWVTVSPKYNMSGGYEVLEECLQRANEIKMPVGRQRDVDKVLELVKYEKPIWLQPLSQSTKATQLCIDTAIRNNFNISIQTHKYIGVR